MVQGGELPLPERRVQPRRHVEGYGLHHPLLQQLLPRDLRVTEVVPCVEEEVRRRRQLLPGLPEPLRVHEGIVVVQVDVPSLPSPVSVVARRTSR